MSVLSKFDRAEFFLQLARQAREKANALASDPSAQAWFDIADSWEFLARLHDNPCFCGRPSVGYKVFPGGGTQPACSEHLRELISSSLLRRMGLEKFH